MDFKLRHYPIALVVDAVMERTLQSGKSTLILSMIFLANRLAHVLFAICFVSSLAISARAQQRPLITEDVDIIPPGSLRLEVGVDFMQRAHFPVSGLSGDLTRAGVIGVNIGLAPNVEFQIEGVAQNFLSINSRGPSAIPLSIAPNAM